MLVRNVYESITFVFRTLNQEWFEFFAFHRNDAQFNLMKTTKHAEMCAVKDNDVGGQRRERMKKKTE